MLESISRKSLAEILSSVTYVSELKKANGSLPIGLASIDIYGLEYWRAVYIINNLESVPLYEKVIEQDGKPRIVLGSPELFAKKFKEQSQKFYLDVAAGIDRMRRHFNYTIRDLEINPLAFAEELFAEIKQRAKVDKKGSVSVSDFCTAIFYIAGYSFSQEHIKQIVNGYSGSVKQYYVYETKQHIEHHYALFKGHNIAVSCMSKGVGGMPYGYAVVDKDKAEEQGYEIQRRRDADGTYKHTVFTANVECFNNLENTSLGLISEVPPNEIANAKEYPFVGRFILFEKEKGKKVWTTYYGREGLRGFIPFEWNRHLVGMQFKAYPNFVRQTELSYQGFIVPYIDGDNRAFEIDTTKSYVDDVGRTYHLATVSDITVSDIQDSRVQRKKDHLYTCSQSYWLARKPDFVVTCLVTGQTGSHSEVEFIPELEGYVFTEYSYKFADKDYAKFARWYLDAYHNVGRMRTFMQLLEENYKLTHKKD